MAGQQRLGSLLVDLGFIDDGQLESALEEQQRTGKRLGKILVDASVITEDRLVHALSRQLGIEVCDPLMTHVHQRVLEMIPVDLAYQYRILPMAMRREDTGDILFVATSDPLNKNALTAIRGVAGGRRVRWLIAGETEMELALARHYGSTQHKPRPGQPTPMPHGMPVITGTPISAPKGAARSHAGTGTLDVPRAPEPRPVKALARPGNGGVGSSDLGEELPEIEVARPIDAPPIFSDRPSPSRTSKVDDSVAATVNDLRPPGLDSASAGEPTGTTPLDWPVSSEALSAEELPPIDVPPEFLTNAEAGLLALESDLPSVSESIAHGDQAEELKSNGRSQRPGSSLLPTSGMSWGDMVGGSPPAFDGFDDRPEDPPQFSQRERPEPLVLDPIETLEIDMVELAGGSATIDTDVVRARDVSSFTDVPIDVDEPEDDPTELGAAETILEPEPVPDLEELPDASDDILPASDPRSAVLEASGDLSRVQTVRSSILRFVDDGIMDDDPVFVLRLLATILEREGLLDEPRISAALEILDRSS